MKYEISDEFQHIFVRCFVIYSIDMKIRVSTLLLEYRVHRMMSNLQKLAVAIRCNILHSQRKSITGCYLILKQNNL